MGIDHVSVGVGEGGFALYQQLQTTRIDHQIGKTDTTRHLTSRKSELPKAVSCPTRANRANPAPAVSIS